MSNDTINNSNKRITDRIGQRFTHSVVVGQSTSRKGRTWWVLECDCGNKFEASSKRLGRNDYLSCGCKGFKLKLTPEPGQMACEVPSPKNPQGRTGTYAGYQAHVKIEETPCDECESARASYHQSKWLKQTDEQRAIVREKNRIATKLYSERHPDRRKDIGDARRAERAPIIRDAKDKPCADCGIQYPYYVMQFDHVRGEKKFNVGGGWNNSIESIKEEIAKCDVVCANCHAERTYQRMIGGDEVAV